MGTLFWGLNLLELSVLLVYVLVMLVFFFSYLRLRSAGKPETMMLRFYQRRLWFFIGVTVIVANVIFFDDVRVNLGALVCVTIMSAVAGAFIHWFLWNFAGLPELEKK